MEEAIIGMIENYGYLAVALLIFVENIFPPIPSEVILLFGGFMTVSAGLNVWLVILAATLGSMLGAVALYFAGYLLGKERVKRFCKSRVGRILHLSPQAVDKAEEKFLKYGYRAVLICRCVPVVRSIISVPAGMSKMKMLPFFSFTLIGSATWNTILVLLGVVTGSAWESCLKYFGAYTFAAVAAIVVAALVAAYIVWRKKSKNKQSKTEEE